MGGPRVLFIDDDRSFREAVTVVLERAGYEVRADPDGSDLAGVVAEFRPDLAIFDVRLPDGRDGFHLAASLRATADVPIVFVTAADELEDRLHGFEVGADDYLVKPLAVAELLARIQAVLRRVGPLPLPVEDASGLAFDEEALSVHRGDIEIQLTRIEFEVLRALAREPGQVLSRRELMSLVWGFDGYRSNLVEVHVSALRRKLGEHGLNLIHTERGRGYVLRVRPD